MTAPTAQELELIAIRKEKEAELGRIKKIKNAEETNTSTAGHIAAWSLPAAGVSAVQTALEPIPDFFYPDNPAKKPILSFLNFSYWSGFFLQWISPVALAMSYVSLADSVERLYKAENRNYEHYLDTFVSFATAAASTTMFFFVGAKIALFLALTAFALNATYGLMNSIKHLGYALFASNAEDRKRHLINAGKQLISIVTNTLAFTACLLLGVKMTSADTLEAIGGLYNQAKNILTGLTVSAVAGIAADSAQKTLGTIRNFFQHPVKAMKKIGQDLKQEFYAHPIKSILKLPFQIALLPLRIVTIPLQLLLCSAVIGINKLMNSARPIPQDDKKEISAKVADEKVEPQESPSKSVYARIQSQLDEYKGQYKTEAARANAPDRIRAKWQLLEEIAVKKFDSSTQQLKTDVSIDTFERDAKGVSSGLYSSFFRRVGRTQQIVEDIRALEKKVGNKI